MIANKLQFSEIFIASDHAGFHLKEYLKQYLQEHSKNFSEIAVIKDFGCDSAEEPVDYPDYGKKLCNAVEIEIEIEKSHDHTTCAICGILICGSGIGMSIVANRSEKIRAGLAWSPEIATLAREHNDINVLVLPARFISKENAAKCLENFLKTKFQHGRYQIRVEKLSHS